MDKPKFNNKIRTYQPRTRETDLKRLAILKERYRNDPIFREQQKTRERERRRRKRRELIELYGGKCVKCGFEDFRALQLDHINGGGRQHILNTGRRFYAEWLRTKWAQQKMQLLCANCNWIKKWENNEIGKGAIVK